MTTQSDEAPRPGVMFPGLRLPDALRISPLVLILIAILLVLIVPPVIFLVNASFHETLPDGSSGAFTLRFYRQLVSGRFFLPSLANTMIYACGSAAIAIFIGTVQALIVERTNAPGRKLAFLAAIISLGVPHVLYTVAWLLLLGRAGPVNDLIKTLFDQHQALNVYSLWGMMLIEGVGFVPLTFLLMSAVLRSTDASFEEAAMMSGASPMRAFRDITLRMALPALCGLTLLIFVKAFESFEVPALVGLAGNVSVITTMIYQSSRRAGSPDYGEAGAYSICLVVILFFLIVWQNRLSQNAQRYQTITGKGFRPRLIDLGPWRFAASAVLIGLFLAVTVVPVGMLVFTSFLPFYEGVTLDSFSRMALDNYALLIGPGSFRDSIVNTLVLGAATATLVVPFTALCAWLVVRRAPGAAMLDQIAAVPLIFPAIILSVAFLDVFVNMSIPLYGTLLSVIIASSVRYLPYGMRYAFAGTMQIHSDLEEAATISGATRARIFFRVLVPLLASALISSWLLIFLLSTQAVSLPLLLVGPGSEVMSVTLFELWQNGQVTELAAMGVLWIALMTMVSVAFHMLTRRHQMAV
ncbi:MAG: iron ABC transporter permease [Beijerinckiaceae bacterium]|nr:iron ABC transporter permease [Beijerinckiaceae bacterium]